MSDKSPREIEREIEEERAALQDTLESLSDKLSVDRMVRTVGDQISEHGGEIGANLSRTVRDNPIPAAMVGVGLAWLIAGSARRTDGATERVADRSTAARYPVPATRDDVLYDRRPAWGQDPSLRAEADGDSSPGGIGATAPTSAGGGARADYDRRPNAPVRGFADTYPGGEEDFMARVERADREMRMRESGQTGMVRDQDRRGEDDEDGPSRMERMRAAGEGFLGRARDAWGTTTASVRGRTYAAYMSAREMADRMMEGTESMDEEGRNRVADARARAWAAQARAEQMGRGGRDRAATFYDEQPLVAGAVAFAVGAAVGAMLPRTRREDEAFGGYRDQVFAEAERVFEDERRRVEAAAAAALREGKQIVSETKDEVLSRVDGKETVDDAEAKARGAVDRIADAARDAHDHPERART